MGVTAFEVFLTGVITGPAACVYVSLCVEYPRLPGRGAGWLTAAAGFTVAVGGAASEGGAGWLPGAISLVAVAICLFGYRYWRVVVLPARRRPE
jgi:hypothetical protein